MSDDFKKIKLGGLWKNTTKNGQEYFAGDFTFGNILQVWPNKKREGKRDPDYTVYLMEKTKKETANPADTLGDIPF